MIDERLLADTIIEVSKNRETLENLDCFDDVLQSLNESSIFNDSFKKYKEEQYPSLDISLQSIFDEFKHIKSIIDKYQHTEI